MIVTGTQYILTKDDGQVILVVPDEIGPPFFAGPSGPVDEKTAQAFIERYSNPGPHATHTWREEAYTFEIGKDGRVTQVQADELAARHPKQQREEVLQYGAREDQRKGGSHPLAGKRPGGGPGSARRAEGRRPQAAR